MSSELESAEPESVQSSEVDERLSAGPEPMRDQDPADIDWILRELADGYDHLPREAILEARRAPREQIVPRLIDEIRRATLDVKEHYGPDGEAHFFALYLLCEFRAREALPVILEAVSLPGEGPFDLFNGVITEDLARIILTLADDPLPVLESLIGNWEVNQYVRWQAVSGYRHLVRDGRLSRDEAVVRMLAHLRLARETEDHELLVPLLSELANYEPREGREEIRAALASDYVEEYDVSLRDYGTLFDANPDESAPPTVDLRNLRPSQIDDTIEELQDWACFRGSIGDDEDEYELDDDEPEYDDESWTADDELPGLYSPASLTHRFEPLAPEEPLRTERLQAGPRIGRNEPCPCGSGKKFKKCCGAKR